MRQGLQTYNTVCHRDQEQVQLIKHGLQFILLCSDFCTLSFGIKLNKNGAGYHFWWIYRSIKTNCNRKQQMFLQLLNTFASIIFEHISRLSLSNKCGKVDLGCFVFVLFLRFLYKIEMCWLWWKCWFFVFFEGKEQIFRNGIKLFLVKHIRNNTELLIFFNYGRDCS